MTNWIRPLLALVCAFAFVSSLRAQYGNAPRPPEPKHEPLNTGGTLKGIAPGVLYVQGEDGEKWAVAVPQQAREVSYSNTAETAWLRSGMFIEFNARVTGKGEVTAPISAVNVMTPSDRNPPGVFSEAAGGGATKELFSDPKEAEPVKKVRKGEEVGDFRIVGQLGGAKDGKVQVNAGGVMLKVEFTDDAKVAVEVNSLLLARPGDQVQIRGWYYEGAKGKAVANQVSVTGKEPLKAETGKKKPLPPMKTEKADKAADKADEKS